jgi:hypothetical protein
MSAPETGQGSGYRRKVISGWCALHGGAREFSSIVIRKVEDGIELDPHAVGACVLTIDKENARMLVETVAQWLR